VYAADYMGWTTLMHAVECKAGLLTQGGGVGGWGGRGLPGPLACRFHSIPTDFPLHLHGI
jgi:hypothetical protein